MYGIYRNLLYIVSNINVNAVYHIEDQPDKWSGFTHIVLSLILNTEPY
jgi:hypothetical protein